MAVELTVEILPLVRLAAKIQGHLQRMAEERPTEYDRPLAWLDFETGKIAVVYMKCVAEAAGGPEALFTEADAQEYLTWLDAGNSERHYFMKNPNWPGGT